MTAQEALKHYFGYDSFRPLQEEVIESVLSGKDTLALMPTGGGKSLCFQVPTMVMEKLTLVITPLIALMKDQVEHLKDRRILATAIYSGMSYDKQKVALDNCLFGPYRFLYVSPERLENEDFRQRLQALPIGLIVVDEAHCICEWGYDFRPSYLRIASIRREGVPILALTATATAEVAEDIQTQLAFREPNIIRQSFRRENLQYVVRTCADLNEKIAQMQHIVSRVEGSVIVYVRNRKHAEEWAHILGTHCYHAGLDPVTRARRQEQWMQADASSPLRVIVCTNAFGMGIDKPDVRLVLHVDMPDSIESYFQEAGRAGRDGEKAYAVLLFAPLDITIARRRVAENYPSQEFVEKVYHKLSDYLMVGAGSGLGHTFMVHLFDFISRMHLPSQSTLAALQWLTTAGYIAFEPEQETQARVRIDMPVYELRQCTFSDEQETLLQSLMRRYTGIFTDLQYLHEPMTNELHQLLVSLAQRRIITYVPRTVAARVTYVQERQTQVFLPKGLYGRLRERYIGRLKAILDYAQTPEDKQTFLVSYFGEE